VIYADVTANPRSVSVPLWGSLTDYEVIPGMMILWEGGTPLPANWVLCDGTGTAPDLRDYFIKVSDLGGEFVVSGDNTISVSGTSTPVSHSHQGAQVVSGTDVAQFSHSNDVPHSHEISGTDSYTPLYYALSVLMFDP